MEGLGREGDLRAVTGNNIRDLEQDVLLDVVKMDPLLGLGEGVDQDVQRRWAKGIEGDDERLVGLDLRMAPQHLPNLGDDRLHLRQIVVANTDRLLDAAIAHAGGVLHHDVAEQGIGHVDGILVEGPHARVAPADILHGPLDLFIRRADPLPDDERSVEIDRQATEEIRQNVLGRETHRDAADAAEGEQTGDTETQRLHHHQRRDDDGRDTPQLRQRVHRGVIHVVPRGLPDGDDVPGRVADKPHKEPRDTEDHHRVADGRDELEDRRAVVFVNDLRCEGDADDPNQDRERSAQGAEQGIVPYRGGTRGELPAAAQQKNRQDVECDDDDDHRYHLDQPGFGEKFDVETI